ncbi:MAG TPA: PrsW family intramembrane metalloprotease [Firmicutes bacterium]|nr:PrsW family intramembrane metalloprotease [Bacillota bacterium]
MIETKVGLIPLLIVSFLPGLFWVGFFYKKDRLEPEPKKLIIRTFLYGALAVFPAAMIETPFRPLIRLGQLNLVLLLPVTILVVGLVEESLKLLATWISVYDSPDFNEVMDGIIYSVSSGLGFAALENLLYAGAFGVAVGLVRAVITCLAHASFSGIAGYYLGRARFDHDRAQYFVIKGLTLAVVFHGVYDFLILGGILPPSFAVVMVAGVYLYLSRKLALAESLSPFKK